MGDAARVHRAAFDQRLPWLAGRHTPQEDADYFAEHVFAAGEVWGALAGAELIGFIAFREGWIDQLYVLPEHQGQGVGGELLALAKRAQERLQLWTFQRNTAARRFYERCGFRSVASTDGAANDEREPDMLYAWVDAGSAEPAAA